MYWENISKEEYASADACLQAAIAAGATGARLILSKSTVDLYSLRNGILDKVSHSGDNGIVLSVFADGRFFTSSTNRLKNLGKFALKTVETARMLAPDEFRKLADPARTEKGALTGNELELYDSAYAGMTAERRIKIAREGSVFGPLVPIATGADGSYKIISEELEYGDCMSGLYMIDSNGLNCKHFETVFDISCETTIEDSGGNKFSGAHYDSACRFDELDYKDCGVRALRRAVAQMAPRAHKGGKFTMVVENEVAGKMLRPLLNALNASSIQQNNSFLKDSLGKQIFPKGLNIMDKPREAGRGGSKLFDSEGVATKEAAIIENGVVKEYFVNTYMAGKTGFAPTVDNYTRVYVNPYLEAGGSVENLDLRGIMEKCGEGIMVTGFNGGNCNSVTGDFSYGVEGFAFKEGRTVHPVRGMVITGNFVSLWNNLLAAGADPRKGSGSQIPTLAFGNVDFSA